MKQVIRIFYTTLALMIFPMSIVRADTLLIETLKENARITVPARGSTMAEVEARFGAADRRLDAVGDPPITRWIYPQFTVYFEYDRVIHSVVDYRLAGNTQETKSEENAAMEAPPESGNMGESVGQEESPVVDESVNMDDESPPAEEAAGMEMEE